MALSFTLRGARAEELDALVQLLQAARLPLDGVAEGFPHHYAVACVAERVVAAAGLEPYGAAGLLRSVVVHDSVRGQGLGRALIEDRLERARALDLERVFLLTTSADAYFRTLGFTPAERGDAPAAMQISAEFSGACPASATCLARRC
jgi:amino-acid N-acetyltransferase